MKPDARFRFFSLSLSGQPIMPAIEASHPTMEIRLGTIQVFTQTLLNTAARQALNWQPTRFDLKSIIEDAWKWECRKMLPTELAEPQRREETPGKTPACNKPVSPPCNSMDYDKQPSEAEGK